MEKEEEGEKHLQDILAAGTVDCGMLIPTPECTEIQVSAKMYLEGMYGKDIFLIFDLFLSE